jgi:hypothetical protein
MTTPLRLALLGAMYHTTGRGNARAAIYADAADRGTFLIREKRGQRIFFSEDGLRAEAHPAWFDDGQFPR